jgi:hypothetical protein
LIDLNLQEWGVRLETEMADSVAHISYYKRRFLVLSVVLSPYTQRDYSTI